MADFDASLKRTYDFDTFLEWKPFVDGDGSVDGMKYKDTLHEETVHPGIGIKAVIPGLLRQKFGLDGENGVGIGDEPAMFGAGEMMGIGGLDVIALNDAFGLVRCRYRLLSDVNEMTLAEMDAVEGYGSENLQALYYILLEDA